MTTVTTTKSDTEYAINAHKLVDCATNCENLLTSHKVSLSFSGIGANFFSPLSNLITFPTPAGPVPMAVFT
eukprot:8473363-Ditylum_brightwellii.AAC.1